MLSNIVLDEFDRESERCGLRFAKYADDSNIYVRSRRAGERVMESLKRFLTAKLKIKVNEQKSAVAGHGRGSFLYEPAAAETADCAKGRSPIQRADPETDGPDARCEHRTDGRRPDPIFAGKARLFREM